MIRPVKKLLLILMLALLPFQLTWAAVAVYCQHEQEQAGHFGHHSHEHQAQPDKKLDDSAEKGKLPKIDVDCPVCHISAQPTFLATFPLVTLPKPGIPLAYFQAYYSSHVPDGPQKPDWQLVA